VEVIWEKMRVRRKRVNCPIKRDLFNTTQKPGADPIKIHPIDNKFPNPNILQKENATRGIKKN